MSAYDPKRTSDGAANSEGATDVSCYERKEDARAEQQSKKDYSRNLNDV